MAGKKGIDLQQIVDGSPVPTFVIDAEHRVTHWNLALAVLTGIPAKDVIGTHHQWRAFYRAHRPVMADLIIDGVDQDLLSKFYLGKYRRSSLVEGAIEAEDYFPAMGDGGRWLYFTAAPLRDDHGRLIGAIETLQDISERKAVENAWRESERKLSDIVAGSPIPTFVIDQERRVTHWNHACEALTGVAAQEVLGKQDAWRAFYTFDSRRVVLAEMIVERASVPQVEAHYQGRAKMSQLIPGAWEAEDYFPSFGDDGKWLRFMAAPLHNVKGDVVGAIETLLDISDSKQLAASAAKQETK